MLRTQHLGDLKKWPQLDRLLRVPRQDRLDALAVSLRIHAAGEYFREAHFPCVVMLGLRPAAFP
jgi:hypothetical protein